jgi:hypothetical protein
LRIADEYRARGGHGEARDEETGGSRYEETVFAHEARDEGNFFRALVSQIIVLTVFNFQNRRRAYFHAYFRAGRPQTQKRPALTSEASRADGRNRVTRLKSPLAYTR